MTANSSCALWTKAVIGSAPVQRIFAWAMKMKIRQVKTTAAITLGTLYFHIAIIDTQAFQ